MAISTYPELTAAVARWMNRTDLDAQIPDFITIAESRIALSVRSWQMIQRVTFTQTAGEFGVVIPEDWLEWDRIWLDGEDEPLTYADFDYFSSLLIGGDMAHSGKYTMDGNLLVVIGTIATGQPDQVIHASYYARMPPLSEAGPENWLLAAHPEVYLYGAAVSGWQYLLDEQRAATNDGLFSAAINSVNNDALRAKLSGSQWRQRPR